MKRNKTLGIFLFLAGVIILALSLLADSIGVGGAAGFGFRQIIGTAAGAVAAIVGLVIIRKK
jgi:cell shape-determining protein MreC